MTQSRKRRGRESEIAVAAHLAKTIWPYAEPTGSGTPGRDVTSTPGADIEVKARRALDLMAWLRQAARHGDGLPILIVRPDGMGEASVGQWAAILTLDDLIGVLRAAGYGEPPATVDINPYGDDE